MHDRHALPGTDVVVDGVRIRVAEHGPADAPPLLLLHGLGTTSALWSDVARDLEHRYRCLLPDLVGAGGSESPADRAAYPLTAQASRMLGLLDALDVRRCAVAGHDIGGSVAVHVAALAPERVGALALLSATVHAEMWPVPAALPYLVPGLRRLALTGLGALPSVGVRVLRRTMGTALPDETLRRWLRPMTTPDGARGTLALFRAVDLAPTEAALGLLSGTRTLVLWGEQDRLHDLAYGRRVAAALPRSVWVPVHGGHLLPAERPERVAEELHAFLADAA